MIYKNCHCCGSELNQLVYDFGFMPAVNSYITLSEVKIEKKFPLSLYICNKCWLLQLNYVPVPELLFTEYHHVSGASVGNVEHLKSVSIVLDGILKNKKSKIFEIGCNDGTLLKFLNAMGHDVLGCDPAKNIKQPNDLNIYKDFFNINIANKIISEQSKFDIVIGINVFAHNAGFMNMIQGCEIMLADNGILMVEVAYALDTVCDGNFDTIYHEHVCSYTLISLSNVLQRAGLSIYDATLISTQGGSLRAFAKKQKNSIKQTESYKLIYKNEIKNKLNDIKFYQGLSLIIENKIKKIKLFLNDILKTNKKLLIVGAPARGVVTLNVCDINLKNKAVIIDDTREKQGKIMPGVHLPVYSWEKINFADYEDILILSWNYADGLINRIKNKNYVGNLYIPFPDFRVIKINK
jgi:SAM-dependent methyltransferase